MPLRLPQPPPPNAIPPTPFVGSVPPPSGTDGLNAAPGFLSGSQTASSSVPASDAEVALVKKWTQRIRSDREFHKAEFDRMRESMEFVAGIQMQGQVKMNDEDRTIVNLVNRLVNQKVATLYAKDPKAIARRRKRLDFQLYDGQVEHMTSAVMGMQNMMTGQAPFDPNTLAMIQDFENGMRFRDMVDRVSRTLETVYQYEVDSQEPDFKTQMKQLVRRAVVCGVAFVGVKFERAFEDNIDSTGTASTMVDRVKRAQFLASQLAEGEFDSTSADFEELHQLMNSLMQNAAAPSIEQSEVKERLVFDFIPATNIIIDRRCRCLKGFVGAHYIAQEFILPTNFLRAMFEIDSSWANGQPVPYDSDGTERMQSAEKELNPQIESMACLWCVYDLDTRSYFHIIDGYERYAEAPMPPSPDVSGFWPIRALTFNDVEVEPGQKASIYPPSDVDLMRSAQKEWNRIMGALRDHRKANGPRYFTGQGWLTDEDKNKIVSSVPNQVIELQGATKGQDIKQLFAAFPVSPVDPMLYDLRQQNDAIMIAAGTQEANLGPARADVTATVGTIAEQSRATMSSSNVDDLDDFLSWMAKTGGQILLMEMSPMTVTRVAGPGAVWPMANRMDFVNAIYLEIEAASSGRPNKAIEIQNMQQLGPMLMQLGANPMFLVREIVKRLDDRIDLEEAFPLMPTAMNGGLPPGGAQGGSPEKPQPPGPPNAGRPPGTSMQEQTGGNQPPPGPHPPGRPMPHMAQSANGVPARF